MRVCPQCNTQYSDDTLRYCLQDGTPLSPPVDEGAPTLVVDRPEVETDPRGRRIDVTPVDRANSYRDQTTPARGSRLPMIVAAAILGTLLVAGLGAVGAWLYFSSRQSEVANSAVPANTPTRNTNINTAANTQPSPTPTSPVSSPTPDATLEVNEKEIKSEVTQIVKDWRANTEDFDIDSYMGHYAPRVDYYNKSGANKAAVRADKQRAFSRYDTIRLDVTDLRVTVDRSGDTATAVFDKEWNFSGEENSSGKVQQMLRFRNFNGDWLITAEEDLKVYYTR